MGVDPEENKRNINKAEEEQQQTTYGSKHAFPYLEAPLRNNSWLVL